MKGCVSREGTRRGGRTEDRAPCPRPALCPEQPALGGKILGSASSNAKPQVRQGRKIHSGVSWPPGPQHLPPNLIQSIFMCVSPPQTFYFNMPDDSCIFGPLAFEEAREHYDFPMLKKEKKTPLPQDVLY